MDMKHRKDQLIELEEEEEEMIKQIMEKEYNEMKNPFTMEENEVKRMEEIEERLEKVEGGQLEVLREIGNEIRGEY